MNRLERLFGPAMQLAKQIRAKLPGGFPVRKTLCLLLLAVIAASAVTPPARFTEILTTGSAAETTGGCCRVLLTGSLSCCCKSSARGCCCSRKTVASKAIASRAGNGKASAPASGPFLVAADCDRPVVSVGIVNLDPAILPAPESPPGPEISSLVIVQSIATERGSEPPIPPPPEPLV